jgi:hypothetical protein
MAAENLVDSGSWVESFISGANRVLDIAASNAQKLYDVDKQRTAIVTQRSVDQKKATLAGIEAQREVDRARAAAAAEQFDFSRASKLAQSALEQPGVKLAIAVGVAGLAWALARRGS